ncbi:C-type lectin domain family 4 member E-like [Tubulanus polymorphus]|uniref:C-type lectin domain family 4 member E-like n=1 Tax=Tubulanus polymorphus TaxID=672921 RepID=UPI003DA3251A
MELLGFMRQFLLVILITGGYSTNADGCSSGWESHSSNCYLFNDTKIAYKEAESKCRKLGAYVVNINDRSEWRFITGVLKSKGNGLNRNYWTGGYRINLGWRWSHQTVSLNSTAIRPAPYLKISPGSTVAQEGDYLTLTKLSGRSEDSWWMKVGNRENVNTFICEVIPNRRGGRVCPYSYDLVGSSCYRQITKTWAIWEALRFCSDDAAHLLAIDNQQEMTSLSTYLDSRHIESDIWIGGIYTSGIWVWHKDYLQFLGNPHQFKAWALGQPDNWRGSETRIVLKGTTYKYWYWHDSPEGAVYGYICEKQQL